MVSAKQEKIFWVLKSICNGINRIFKERRLLFCRRAARAKHLHAALLGMSRTGADADAIDQGARAGEFPIDRPARRECDARVSGDERFK